MGSDEQVILVSEQSANPAEIAAEYRKTLPLRAQELPVRIRIVEFDFAQLAHWKRVVGRRLVSQGIPVVWVDADEVGNVVAVGLMSLEFEAAARSVIGGEVPVAAHCRQRVFAPSLGR